MTRPNLDTKKRQAEAIDKQVAEFLANGGTITELPSGVTSYENLRADVREYGDIVTPAELDSVDPRGGDSD